MRIREFWVNHETACDLFEKEDGEELISNYRYHKEHILKPYEARVMLLGKN